MALIACVTAGCSGGSNDAGVDVGTSVDATTTDAVADVPESSAGSCSDRSDAAQSFLCTDYGQGYSASDAMSICSRNSRPYASTACPSATRVGRCVVTATTSGSSRIITENYYPPETTAGVMSHCMSANLPDAGLTAVFFAN